MAKTQIAQKIKYRNDLSADFVRSILIYIPESGEFFWKERIDVKRPKSWNKKWAGKKADTYSTANGYRGTHINGKFYYTHRLAFLIVTGEWPKNDVDHINNKRADNRWNNLRDATRSENSRNSAGRLFAPYKGIYLCKKTGKWRARISVNNNTIDLGRYSFPDEAFAVYCRAAEKYHGEFANLKSQGPPPSPAVEFCGII